MDLVNNDELYNKYENLENNLVNDDEYENLDEIFYNENENFGGLSDIEKDKSDEKHDEIVTQLKDKQELSPCVIIDVFENKIQRCNSTTNLKQLWQMVGMWQIDEEEIKKKNFLIKNLGVCYTHFMYDQNKLHILSLKQTKNYTESIIHHRRCLFCNKNKFFFSRSKNCVQHSYIVMGKNIQVPCIGQKKCGALQEYHPLVFSTESSKYARYICMACYEEKGGHIYQRVRRGVREDPNCDNMSHHENDTKKALEAIGYWILDIAASEKSIWQNKLLIHLVLFINQLNQEKSDNTLDILTPSTDTEINPKSLNYENINKQITFFVSIILNIVFKGWKIWLPRIMASLCRKPKLLLSLQEILKIVNITSHTQRHERNLEKICALLVDPTNRILRKKNIWNLGIIDNIDFKETTFGYGNIFDAIRIFEKLLAFNNENFTYQSNFDESDIRNEIITYFKVGCNFSPPNIVILNAGDPPSNDSAVHECLKMYANEIGIENDGYINVVADEAIFRRVGKECGLRATSKVLELIWVAVGLAIHLYAKKKKQNLNNILEENKLIKHESLKAFSPLFPISGKLNYAWSVTHHLYCIENNSKLCAMLRIAPSVNLTSPRHFFAYDEALETFGVKFVKQNVTRIPTDSEELKLKIKATQLEKERTDMLICDYIGDYIQSSKPRNIQSRKEKIWEFVHLLVNAFESTNPFENPIFEFCNNLNDKEINQLVVAYDIGIRRL
ncbi:hypothetical protein GLOIN_2v1829825 [Rhizophagus clarus]|uniref:Uncharacterized protein n=1 Tax=Rhizophagus clarus TaxID=94130 RepID=A0A8H3LYK8_9GLOM|nr:hypothetical protein GLOIN_2v1829825 [Rhizophagus clarus]